DQLADCRHAVLRAARRHRGAVYLQYSACRAVMSVLVNTPASTVRKHEFMTEPPTTAPLGVPGMRIAPTPASPSLVAAPPQLMLRRKKSEWRKPTQWPSSWVMTCATVLVWKLLSPRPMLIELNGRPFVGKPELPPTGPLSRIEISASQPAWLPRVRSM